MQLLKWSRKPEKLDKLKNSPTFDNDGLLFDLAYSIVKIPKDFLAERLTTEAIAINTLNQILSANFYGITNRVAKKY